MAWTQTMLRGNDKRCPGIFSHVSALSGASRRRKLGRARESFSFASHDHQHQSLRAFHATASLSALLSPDLRTAIAALRQAPISTVEYC